jgi:hypothetical protein
MSATEKTILCSVDMDCDGPLTYFQRVTVPVGLRDADAARHAMLTEQMSGGDASEWFTMSLDFYHRHCHARCEGRYGGLGDTRRANPDWASMNGLPPRGEW